MSKVAQPNFKETAEQRQFRQTYMKKVHAVYRFDESLGIMDLGEDKKISLQDIYVPLRFSKQQLSETRDWDTEEDTLSLMNILDISRHIVLSGRPGSGKTTISRMIINLLSSRALTALAEKCGRRLPLYFKLRDYKISNIPSAETLFASYITSQGRTLGFDLSLKHFEFYLKKGWCFLIFDGVDEVGGSVNRLKIREFVLNHFTLFHPENYVIVTSRPSGLENVPFSDYLNEKEQHKQLYLLNHFYTDSFNKSQAQQFSHKWFTLREENPEIVKKKSDEFLDSVEKIKSLSVLRRRPVFLTMMAHIHTTKGKLPHSRATAYEYMVEAYIENIDITRRLHKDLYPEEHYYEWSFEDKIKLLQGIAYKFQLTESTDEEEKDEESLIVVNRKDLLSMIKTIIEENKESWQTILPEHTESLFRFYLTRTGLLHEPEEDKVQFSHLSFQEYLTARFIYREVIDNYFSAFEIIKQNIVTRLAEKLYSRWSEIILLFFSLSKATTHATLCAIQKELNNHKEDHPDKIYDFYTLVLDMLDSEEYGIKESDMLYWVEQVLEYIVNLDVHNTRESSEESNSTQNKGFDLIKTYFTSTERSCKINLAEKILNKLFDRYFQAIQKDYQNTDAIRKLENTIYAITYDARLANPFKSKAKETLPVILDRKHFDLQFISCAELFAYSFDEFSEIVAGFYTIDEAIICQSLLSGSILKEFSRKERKYNWKIQLLEWEWIIEKLFIFSFLKRLHITYSQPNENLNELAKINNKLLFTLLEEAIESFWKKCWFGNVWHGHPGGLLDATKRRTIERSRAISLLSRDRHMIIDDWPEKYAPLATEVNRIIALYNKKSGREEFAKELGWLKTLISSLLFVYANIRFEEDYRKIRNPWQTFHDLEKFSNLIGKPESLYDHLLEICPEIIDKSAFLQQYHEYDQKPYSMRKMIEKILDRGEEDYPTFSNKEAIELSIKLSNKICDEKEKLLKHKGKMR